MRRLTPVLIAPVLTAASLIKKGLKKWAGANLARLNGGSALARLGSPPFSP